jgi:hypothetical protein
MSSPSFTGVPAARSPAAHPPYVTAGGRDLRLDILRGYCVFAMIVDHIAWLSPLHLLSGGDRFLFGAAEGFILISGITAGIVYRSFIAREGMGAAWRKALLRAFNLYLLAVGLALFVGPIYEALHASGAQGVDLTRPLDFVVQVLTLQRTYTLADVMVLYALLLALMPVALYAMRRGLTWLVLGVSALMWLAHQVFPAFDGMPWRVQGNWMFLFASWQALFFGALALGYHRDRLPRVTPVEQRRLHWITGVSSVALIAFFVFLSLSADRLPAALQDLSVLPDALRVEIKLRLFAKPDVGIGRIVSAAVISTFVFLSLTRWWSTLGRVASAVFLPFGQHALYAYTLHTLFVMIAIVAAARFGMPRNNLWLNALIQVAALAVIWFCARRQILAPTPATLRFWQAAPLGLAVVLVVALS